MLMLNKMKKSFKQLLGNLRKFYRNHKKPILIVGGVVLITLFVFVLFSNTRSDTVTRTDPNSDGKTAKPEIVLVPSPLTGLEVTSDLAGRPTVAAIVENSPKARPQSGLVKAGVVFEFMVEGGITRFVALHQEQMADKVGPIRSLRTQFVDVAMGFNAGVAHDGGDPKAIVEFSQFGGRDLAGGGIYWRANDRAAPHNEYTSGQLSYDYMKQKGFTSSEYIPWERKKDAPLEVPTASSITIDISSFLYKVGYKYNAANNTYSRTMADQAHKDNETGQVIAPKVVIVIQAAHQVIDSAGHQQITLTGSGNAWVFQDGGVTKGKWNKASRTDANFSFVDSEGKTIKLNAGQTWVTTIPLDRTVDYAP